MKKYISPKITERKVVINNFLTRNSFFDPFSDFSGNFNVGSVYGASLPKPPNSGTAGLKDGNYASRLKKKH